MQKSASIPTNRFDGIPLLMPSVVPRQIPPVAVLVSERRRACRAATQARHRCHLPARNRTAVTLFQAELARQFDAWIWFTETKAVVAHGEVHPHGSDETYPFGI